LFSDKLWRETRVRPEPETFLIRTTVGYAKMERLDVEHAQCGIDLQDGFLKLLDLRFADDILLFARTAHEALFFLENLMHEFAEVGLLKPNPRRICGHRRVSNCK